VALREIVPFVPTTAIEYEPVGVLELVEIVNSLAKVGMLLAGLRVEVSPIATGETEDDRLTDWVVPLTSETVTVAVVPAP
jgi:hypothetical protein